MLSSLVQNTSRLVASAGKKNPTSSYFPLGTESGLGPPRKVVILYFAKKKKKSVFSKFPLTSVSQRIVVQILILNSKPMR